MDDALFVQFGKNANARNLSASLPARLNALLNTMLSKPEFPKKLHLTLSGTVLPPIYSQMGLIYAQFKLF
jgi:hypothetical protein